MSEGLQLFLATAACSAVLGFFFWLKSLGRPRASEEWRAAAIELGLAISPDGTRLSGALDGVALSIDQASSRRNAGFASTVIETAPEGGVPWNIGVHGPHAHRVEEVTSGEEVTTGDREFDEAVRVRGPQAHLLAGLGAEGRKLIRELVAQGGEVAFGKIRLEQMGLLDRRLLAHCARTVAAAARLLASVDVPRALAANAQRDPLPAVRLRNLETLLREHARSEAAERVLPAILRDPDPRLRLRAAAAAAGASRDEALHSVLADRAADAGDRVEALRALCTSRSDAALLGRAEELAEGADDRCAEALADALAGFGNEIVQPLLLRLLARPAHTVRCAAARSLGIVGTVAAVEPLLPLTEGVLRGDLSRIARDSIRQIQARLGAGVAGALSLTEPSQEGALSVATPAGALSIAGNQEKS